MTLPADVGIMDVLELIPAPGIFCGKVLVNIAWEPLTMTMDWPEKFLLWWFIGMDVGTRGGGTGVFDRF